MKKLQGKIIKFSGDKTLRVESEYVWTHPKYGKQFKRKKIYFVHVDDATKYKVGAEVCFKESKKISKLKYYKVC